MSEVGYWMTFWTRYFAECLVDGCGQQPYAKTFCRKHYERVRVYGTPVATIPKSRHGLTVTERFWSYVARGEENDCWMWVGGKKKVAGYGDFWNGVRMVRAHRFAFELQNGPIAAGALVLHSCDTPACVNPRHLRTGTARDNVFDAIERGRWPQIEIMSQRRWAPQLSRAAVAAN